MLQQTYRACLLVLLTMRQTCKVRNNSLQPDVVHVKSYAGRVSTAEYKSISVSLASVPDCPCHLFAAGHMNAYTLALPASILVHTQNMHCTATYMYTYSHNIHTILPPSLLDFVLLCVLPCMLPCMLPLHAAFACCFACCTSKQAMHSLTLYVKPLPGISRHLLHNCFL